jgi:hypothetical protein
LFVARKKYFFSNKINVSGQKKKLGDRITQSALRNVASEPIVMQY